MGHEARSKPPFEQVTWSSAGALWQGIGLFVAAFLGAQALAIAVGVPFGLESTGFYAAVFVASAVGELGYAAIALRAARRSPLGAIRAVGIQRPSFGTIAWAGVAVVGALGVAMGYAAVVAALDIDALQAGCADQIPAAVRDNAALLALAAFVVIVIAPPCEELFFRGFLFQGFAARRGVWIGLVASAVLFAIPHLTYRSFLPIAGAGLVFAATFLRSGNLLSSILAHAMFNGVAIAFIAGGTCDA